MDKDNLQRTSPTLLAIDFDGMLARDDDGAAVTLDSAAADFLNKASLSPGVVLAVTSHRDAEDLAARVGPVPAYLIASDGREIRGPRGAVLLRTKPLEAQLDGQLTRNTEVCGFRVERKPYSVTIDWRGVPYLHERHPVVDQFRRWAVAHDLQLIERQYSVEAREQSAGKEAALRWVTSAAAAGRVIFAGDEATDAGALRFASEHGRAFCVKHGEHVPPDGVTVADSRETLVRMLRDEVG
jgi:trehalose-6-phosphatase